MRTIHETSVEVDRHMSRAVRPIGMRQVLVALILAFSSIACGGSSHDAPTPPTIPVASLPVLTRLTVTTDSTIVQAGRTVAAVLAAFDERGQPMTVGPAAWTSNAPTVARVNSSGIVTALAPGSATITARVGSVQGQVALVITSTPDGSLPLMAIHITPNAVNLESGQRVQLAASLFDVADNPLSMRALQWTTSDSTVATVSPSGLVTARTIGTAIIAASSDTVRGATAIAVAFAPDSDILVSFASPVPGVTVGDTLKVEVAVRTVARTDSVWATVGGQRTPLTFGPIGTRASGWSATLNLATLAYGPYVLTVTAIDSRQHRGISVLAIQRDPKALGGSKGNPTANK